MTSTFHITFSPTTAQTRTLHLIENLSETDKETVALACGYAFNDKEEAILFGKELARKYGRTFNSNKNPECAELITA